MDYTCRWQTWTLRGERFSTSAKKKTKVGSSSVKRELPLQLRQQEQSSSSIRRELPLQLLKIAIKVESNREPTHFTRTNATLQSSEEHERSRSSSQTGATTTTTTTKDEDIRAKSSSLPRTTRATKPSGNPLPHDLGDAIHVLAGFGLPFRGEVLLGSRAGLTLLMPDVDTQSDLVRSAGLLQLADFAAGELARRTARDDVGDDLPERGVPLPHPVEAGDQLALVHGKFGESGIHLTLRRASGRVPVPGRVQGPTEAW